MLHRSEANEAGRSGNQSFSFGHGKTSFRGWIEPGRAGRPGHANRERGAGLHTKLWIMGQTPTAWPRVKMSLRAERSNLCPNTEIASSLVAPRNDRLFDLHTRVLS